MRRLVFCVSDWYSGNQTQVSFSSIGCEILAAATACDRTISMINAIQPLHESPVKLPLVLTIYSLGLHGTIKTLPKGKDYFLRSTVTRMRDSFKAGEVSVLQCIAGKQNISDALTERNPAMLHVLNDICNSGTFPKETFEKPKRVLASRKDYIR